MLKRIVAITFVALLSLALAGTSIADTKKKAPPPPPGGQGGQNDPTQQYQQILNSLTQNPSRSTVPKASGTTSRGTVGAKIK
jgi:hypothetical protein